MQLPAELYHFLAFAISLAFVWWSTPLVKQMGLKTGLVDRPDERKVHERPMVRLGGVAIFGGTMLALLVVWLLGGFGGLPPQREWEVWGLVLGESLFLRLDWGMTSSIFLRSYA